MKYKTVLFDWDGCLVHTLEVWADGVGEALKKAKKKFSDRKIIDSILKGDIDVTEFGIRNGELFWKTAQQYVIDNQNKVFLHNGVKEMFAILKKKSDKNSDYNEIRKECIFIGNARQRN